MGLSDEQLGKLVREYAETHAELIQLASELREAGEELRLISSSLLDTLTMRDISGSISLEEVAAAVDRYNELRSRESDYERRLRGCGYSHIHYPVSDYRPLRDE